MQIFLDSASLQEIIDINNLGIIDGVTTNPSLIAQNKENFRSIISSICEITQGDVSVEVSSNDYDSMILEGEKILSIAKNVVLKLPLTWDGVRACKYFAAKSHKVNMTLCFSVNQAIIAGKAGATYVSPFVGRLDDIGQDGLNLISCIKTTYTHYQETIKTKILAASIRNPNHVYRCLALGIDSITAPGKVIKQLLDHPLTTKGLEIFNKDWLKSGLKIG